MDSETLRECSRFLLTHRMVQLSPRACNYCRASIAHRDAIAEDVGREVDYRPIGDDGARLAAERLAALL